MNVTIRSHFDSVPCLARASVLGLGRSSTHGRALVLAFLLASVLALSPSDTVAAAAGTAQADVVSEVEAALAAMSGYDYGDSREPLSSLRMLVKTSLASTGAQSGIEKALIVFLETDAPLAAKQFVCEQLSLIGSTAGIPVLAGMLADEKTADMAIFALQRIPGVAVDEALRESLSSAQGMVAIAIINALGERGDGGTVGALAGLIGASDPEIAESATVALGKIGNGAAAAALDGARSATSGRLRGLVLDAYLRNADAMAAVGDSASAIAIYQDVYDSEDDTASRSAALTGLVGVSGEKAVGHVLSSLMRDNADLQTVAAGLVRGLPADADLGAIIAETADLPALAQIQILSALAEKRDMAGYDAVSQATKHYDESVRAAAIGALAAIGTEADVAMLAELAVSAQVESDREAARASLDAMPGAEVNGKIVALIGDAEPEIRAELVRSLGERKAHESMDLLLATATDPDRSVRAEAFKALAVVAGPEQISSLIDLVVGEEHEGIRNEAERTLVLVSRKDQESTRPAGPVLDALPSVDVVAGRSSLIEVLGKIGDASALPAIRAELASENAEYRKGAIMALSAWPDATPMDDLYGIATTSDNEVNKILALRGYITLLRMRSDRPAEETLELVVGAMELATEPTEKKMAMSVLGRAGSFAALDLAISYLDDPMLSAEAEAACASLVAWVVDDADREECREAIAGGLLETLEGILETAENRQLREWIHEALDILGDGDGE